MRRRKTKKQPEATMLREGLFFALFLNIGNIKVFIEGAKWKNRH